ncbi:MAG TPA: glycosyltransferase [Thermoleophilaceae bacterium]
MADASNSGRRLRVVTLVDHLATSGGGERLAMEISKRLDRQRFEPIHCASRYDPEHAGPATRAAARELEDAGVRLVGLGRTSARSLREWRPLVSLLRRERVEVLHAHKFGSNVWAAVLGRVARVPAVLAHEHTWSFEGQPVRRFLDRELIARGTDAFIAVSTDDRRKMIEVEGIDPDDVTFVPNGIDAIPEGDGARVRQELGIPAEAPVVVAVAVLREQKALDVLVRAAAELRGEFPELRVLIAGSGPQEDQLGALVGELGAPVTLLGIRSDVPDLLAAANVAALSSDYEGSPLAVMEYMDAALPVVATRVGGVPDLIEDGSNGRLVEPQDPAGLARALAEVLRDRDAAAAMGRRGRERRRSEFTIDRTVRTLERMYEDIVARSGRR